MPPRRPMPLPESPPPSIRSAYERCGARDFYCMEGFRYRNPHEAIVGEVLKLAVNAWQLDLEHVLDLACGSGEATLALQALGARRVTGMDPYTGAAFEARVGRPAEALSFEEISAGALLGRRYSLIVCSFALHLVEQSRLPGVCLALSEASDALLILTPHKRPELRVGWGWDPGQELLHRRVRARRYLRAREDVP